MEPCDSSESRSISILEVPENDDFEYVGAQNGAVGNDFQIWRGGDPANAKNDGEHFMLQSLENLKRRCNTLSKEKQTLAQKSQVLERQLEQYSMNPDLASSMDARRSFSPGSSMGSATFPASGSPSGMRPRRSEANAAIDNEAGSDLKEYVQCLEESLKKERMGRQDAAAKLLEWQTKCHELEDEHTIHEELDNAIFELQTEKQSLQQEKQTVELKCKKFALEVDQLRQDRADLESSHAKSSKQVTDLEEEVQGLLKNNKQLEQSIERIRQLTKDKEAKRDAEYASLQKDNQRLTRELESLKQRQKVSSMESMQKLERDIMAGLTQVHLNGMDNKSQSNKAAVNGDNPTGVSKEMKNALVMVLELLSQVKSIKGLVEEHSQVVSSRTSLAESDMYNQDSYSGFVKVPISGPSSQGIGARPKIQNGQLLYQPQSAPKSDALFSTGSNMPGPTLSPRGPSHTSGLQIKKNNADTGTGERLSTGPSSSLDLHTDASMARDPRSSTRLPNAGDSDSSSGSGRSSLDLRSEGSGGSGSRSIPAQHSYSSGEESEMTMKHDVNGWNAYRPLPTGVVADKVPDPATEAKQVVPAIPGTMNHENYSESRTPRSPLNIDRNVDDSQKKVWNRDTSPNVNLNTSEKDKLVPGSGEGPGSLPNNNPFARHSNIPPQNIFPGDYARMALADPAEQRANLPATANDPMRTCPICSEEFAPETPQDTFQLHVERCLEPDAEETTMTIINNPRESVDEPGPPSLSLTPQTPSPGSLTPTATQQGSPLHQYLPPQGIGHTLTATQQGSPLHHHLPPQGIGHTDTDLDDELYTCPVCNVIFPPPISHHSFEVHVNSHFDENIATNFEVLNP